MTLIMYIISVVRIPFILFPDLFFVSQSLFVPIYKHEGNNDKKIPRYNNLQGLHN